MKFRDEQFIRNIRNFIVNNPDSAPLDIDFYLEEVITSEPEELGENLLNLENVVGIRYEAIGDFYNIEIAKKEWV